MKRSIALLVLIQISSLAVPLATMPFLTRVLGPAAWGHLAAIQALSVTLAIVVEYGFQYTATRSVSLERDSKEAVHRIVSEVTTAKLVLSIGSVLLSGIIYLLVPAFQESPEMFILGILYSLVMGWSPIWFFQGIEKLELAASIDVLSKIVSAIWIFLLVRSPEDAAQVIVAQMLTSVVATFVNLFRVHRSAGIPTVQVRNAFASLRHGFPMFLYRATVTVYSAGSTAVLRGMTTSVEAGNYANADRLTTAAKSLIVPVGQVMFPRISRLHAEDPRHAKKVMTASLTIMTVIFAAAGGAAALLGPWVLPWFFGPEYVKTIPIFQVLCLTLPLVAASNVLGIQWMLARGRQGAFNTMVLCSAIASIVSMILIVPAMGGLGMAWSVVIAEALLVLAMGLYTWRSDC